MPAAGAPYMLAAKAALDRTPDASREDPATMPDRAAPLQGW